jgi:hypothetical protein
MELGPATHKLSRNAGLPCFKFKLAHNILPFRLSVHKSCVENSFYIDLYERNLRHELTRCVGAERTVQMHRDNTWLSAPLVLPAGNIYSSTLISLPLHPTALHSLTSSSTTTHLNKFVNHPLLHYRRRFPHLDFPLEYDGGSCCGRTRWKYRSIYRL